MEKVQFIDDLLENVRQKKMLMEDAVKETAVLIQSDFRLFGLGKCDEDERSSIVLEFLRTGSRAFERYKEEYGNFHNYLFSFVKGLKQSLSKQKAIYLVKEQVNYYQSIDNLIDDDLQHDFTLAIGNHLSVPYSYSPCVSEIPGKKYTVKEFMQKRNVRDNSKTTIILAFKACYDLTDYEINLICKEYNIDENDFYARLQEAKESMEGKLVRRDYIINARNAAFFNHRRYSPEFTHYDNATERQKEDYGTSYKINTTRWQLRNSELFHGKYHFSPTNKILSRIFGICVRQINYYLSHIKNKEDVI